MLLQQASERQPKLRVRPFGYLRPTLELRATILRLGLVVDWRIG